MGKADTPAVRASDQPRAHARGAGPGQTPVVAPPRPVPRASHVAPPPPAAAAHELRAEDVADEMANDGWPEELEVADATLYRSTTPMGSGAPLMQGVPRASLVGPSRRAFDSEPPRVPRVSLVPSTQALDPASIPRVPPPQVRAFDSREQPTLGAVSPMPPIVGVGPASAPAVTMPPAHRGRGVARPVAAPFAPAIPSSRREIVTGLAIGIAVSLLLGVLGQAYLESRVHADALPPPASALPGPSPLTSGATSSIPGPHVASHETASASGASRAPGAPPSLRSAFAGSRLGDGDPGDGDFSEGVRSGAAGGSAPQRSESTRQAGAVGAGVTGGVASSARLSSKRAARLDRPRHAAAGSEPARRPSTSRSRKRAHTRLSPSQQAGLGTELSLSD